MAEAFTIPSPTVFLRRDSPPPSAAGPSAEPAAAAADHHVAAETKKKKGKARARAPRPSAAHVSTTEPVIGAATAGVSKPKQSKSRNGCLTCKAKRLKCDEEKPECQQCKKRKVPCGGYKKDFKWRPFEETSVKVNIDRQNNNRGNALASSSTTSPKQGSTASSKNATPTIGIAHGPDREQDEMVEAAHRKKDSVHQNSEVSAALRKSAQLAGFKRKQHSQHERRVTSAGDEDLPEPAPPPLISDDTPPTNDEDSTMVTPEDFQPGSLSHFAPGLGLSPTLTDMLFPANQNKSEFANFCTFNLPDAFRPVPDSVVDPAIVEDDAVDDDVEDIGRGTFPQHGYHLALHARQNHASSQNPFMSPGDIESMGYCLYPQPTVSATGVEMLTWRFDTRTCGVLSVMDGPSENPWRTLIWPLAQQSRALYHAVVAMAAFHASAEVPEFRVVGREHKQASIKFIREGIRDNSMHDETAIATALALGFSESWDQHTATGNTHIKGAQALVKRALARQRRHPAQGIELRRLKFLCNAWVYMDVIARLTSVDSDESNDFDSAFLFLSDQPSMAMGEEEGDGFGIDFGLPVDARLDPLMGCANTLFPLIGRVANLVRKVCRSQTNSPAVISQANELKRALEAWDPPAFIDEPEDPSTDVDHTVQTAEAYRWATLLHLHQSVPELPSPSSADLAQRVLQFLATVPPSSRTVIVQIYPLMVAGCEANTAEDRDWVRERWAGMGSRMHLGIIEKSAIVTEEVWRRRDAYEAQPTTRRKLVATSDVHPVRHRSQPLFRTETGSWMGDPGRTGVVFSYVDGEGDPIVNAAAASNNDKTNRDRRRMPNLKDPAYTVRGHLHWVGVMWDWGWEILLG